MIIVKLQGGLGNQMFQYATGKALAMHYGVTLRLDHHFLEHPTETPGLVIRKYDLDIFRLQVAKASDALLKNIFQPKDFRKLFFDRLGFAKKYQIIQEAHPVFNETLFQKNGFLYLDGYWQSPRYFSTIQTVLRRDFTFLHPLLLVSQNLQTQIIQTNSVCLNVRRTDFVNNPFHPLCTLNYYLQGMEAIKQKIANPHFFIFSDDKEWCHTQFGSMPDCTIVGTVHNGEKYANQLRLMASCRHFIIPNSSFGWWAVWLANQPDALVIAPERWTSDTKTDPSDLIEKHWIQIPN
jgi:hypothetical protein